MPASSCQTICSLGQLLLRSGLMSVSFYAIYKCAPGANLQMQDDGWLHQTDISVAAANVFNDLPKEEGERWAKMSTRHSGSTFPASLSHAGFKDVPVSYLLCTKDLAQEPELQRASIAMMERQIGGKVDVTEIESGHAPNASRPKEVADWIVSIARQSA